MFPVDKKALGELLVALGVDTASNWDAETMQEKVNTNGITYYLPSTGVNHLDADAKFLLGECMERQSKGEKLQVVADPLAYISQPITTTAPEPEKAVEVEPEGKPSTETLIENKEEETSKEPEILQGPESFPEPKQKKRSIVRRSHAQENAKAARKAHKSHKTPKPKKPGPIWHMKVKGWQKKPLSVTDRGAGVMRKIIEELEKAGKEKKPITKSKLLKVLIKAFPDREEAGMKTTIDNLLGSKLATQYRIEVKKTKTLTKVKNRCANCGHQVKCVRGERGYWLDSKNNKQVG